jgi:DNA polymerase-3 subunit alpha
MEVQDMENKTRFAHLHIHSDYSILDSTATITALTDRAEELGMEYLALTDHGNMFGIMDFLDACKSRKNQIKPIIGCEVYVTSGSRLEKRGKEKDNTYYHLVLLAENQQGYSNLIKLCSLAYTEGFYFLPRIDDELLAQYHEGLIALSGCVKGEIPRLILDGKTSEAEQKAQFYNNLFGENNFFLEIQDHGIPAEMLRSGFSQKELNNKIAEISQNTGIPLVATNDVHYIKEEDASAHDVCLCINQGKLRNDENREKFYGDQFYFKTSEEMSAIFPDCEYPEAIGNTVKIAERCVFDVPQVKSIELPDYLPQFTVPHNFASAEEYICHIAYDGVAKRYNKEKEEGGTIWEEIQKRLDNELTTIIQMDFSNYFLIVADYVNWAREHDIPVGPGRGASAGSIVSYALQITDIDPIKYGLLFEHFINSDCISMPDLDIDFGDKGRDDVIKYITEKYGKDHVGKIITFGTMGARMVINDVARALGIPIDEANYISNLIPSTYSYPWILEKAIKQEPKLQELQTNQKYTELFTLASKLQGLHCHCSFHAAGIVIGKSELNNIIPLCTDNCTGEIVTQYDFKHLEKCGLVKFDFLSLRTLDVIKDAEKLIRKKSDGYAVFSIVNIPYDDNKTFELFCNGNTDGVYQFEFDGIKNILKQVQPESIYDLMATISLYYSGTRKCILQFIEVKNEIQTIIYPDPCLEGILKETYGVIVYQEQVTQIIHQITGCSLNESDTIRRVLGKTKKEKFIEKANKNGFSTDGASELFDMIVPFASYGASNKAHATAYTKIAYQTAYLKANYPNEFDEANKIFNRLVRQPAI